MAILDILLKAKSELEKRIEEAYVDQMDADAFNAGPFRIMIRNFEKQLVDIDAKIAKEVQKTEPELGTPPIELKIVKLFLASSLELKPDRDQFEIFINRENMDLVNEGVFIRLIIWENFIDAVSATRLQNEYNKAIEDSDIFVSLFYTKSGLYTQEEFDVALESYKSKGKPKVYTYFKNIADKNAQADLSLEEFKDKLRQIGHFPTSYENIYDLKYQFKMQLQKIDLKKL